MPPQQASPLAQVIAPHSAMTHIPTPFETKQA